MKSIIIVPRGSRWASGLRVTRPWLWGVRSPSLWAAKAWQNSWKQTPIRRANKRGRHQGEEEEIVFADEVTVEEDQAGCPFMSV